MGRKELQHEEHALWKGLDEGAIDNAEMVGDDPFSLMEHYYRGDRAHESPAAPSYKNHVGSVDLLTCRKRSKTS